MVRDQTPLCISQSIALLRTDEEKIIPEFFEAALSGQVYQDKMIFDAGGTTIKHIYITILAKMNIALPPLSDQEKILTFVQRIKRRFDRLSCNAQSAVTLLNERRTALISAAVTGKIDLRDWQPPEGAQAHSTQDIDQAQEALA
jgi:type I restriction enzyme, S subunit